MATSVQSPVSTSLPNIFLAYKLCASLGIGSLCLLMWACSPQTDMSSEQGGEQKMNRVTTGDSRADQPQNITDFHSFSGLYSVSADGECPLTPIGESSLLTLASCLPTCGEGQEECFVAVMNGVGNSMSLFGLGLEVIHHPSYDPLIAETIRRFGPDTLLSFHAYDLAVLNIDRRLEEVAPVTVSLFFESALREGLHHETDEFTVSSLYESGFVYERVPMNEGSSSELICELRGYPLSEAGGSTIVALSIGAVEESCGLAIRLDMHRDFIIDASRGSLNGDYISEEGLSPISDDLAEMVDQIREERTPREDPPIQMIDDSHERDALANAPSSCQSIADDYCDGSVEMRCVNREFNAFDCGIVGWRCDIAEDGRATCEP